MRLKWQFREVVQSILTGFSDQVFLEIRFLGGLERVLHSSRRAR